MVLSENLKKNNILIDISAKTRWEAIEQMLDLAVRNGEIRADEYDIIKKALVDREKSMSTGIGKGVAIPHCTTSKVDTVIIIMATSKTGIDFGSVDNLPVNIIILLIVPKNKLTQHIKTLANIAKMMNNSELRRGIQVYDNPEKILKAIKNYERLSGKK